MCSPRALKWIWIVSNTCLRVPLHHAEFRRGKRYSTSFKCRLIAKSHTYTSAKALHPTIMDLWESLSATLSPLSPRGHTIRHWVREENSVSASEKSNWQKSTVVQRIFMLLMKMKSFIKNKDNDKSNLSMSVV